MDQKSLLMHPKMRAFVSHCGFNSVNEAVQFGVPILAIPLLGDQLYNAIMARVKGIAVQLDVGQLNGDGAELRFNSFWSQGKADPMGGICGRIPRLERVEFAMGRRARHIGLL
ncbi:hypothetical protein niasHS_009708 [Heterodera schachtii]|uniref:glucuronosyltransferase n=1 Tax=Heterodera schachtii TaxID=97005 RepID=A0ABD2J2Q5_HETSC